MLRRLLALLLCCLPCLALAQAPAAQQIDITAPDGIKLRATYFAAGKPGPAVLLLHMCNTTRVSWEPVAQQLAAAGISALTVDNRGFGESGGPRFDAAAPDVQQQIAQKWPADFDADFAHLLAQPGVDKDRIGVGGGSCGVDNAIKVASRHPEVRSMVLLAGVTDIDGFRYLEHNPWIPLFTAASSDDQYNFQFPEIMRWISELSGNPRNRFAGFTVGRHGTEIFIPHPELPRQIVAFLVDTLAKSPAHAQDKFTPRKNPVSDFWTAANQPGGGARATQMFHDARKRDPKAFLFSEYGLNLLGYDRLQAGAKDDAIALLKLNAEAYPKSANTQDSLSDAYIANGQNDLALAAEQKCLELIPGDPASFDFRTQLRQVAEGKIKKLKSPQ